MSSLSTNEMFASLVNPASAANNQLLKTVSVSPSLTQPSTPTQLKPESVMSPTASSSASPFLSAASSSADLAAQEQPKVDPAAMNEFAEKLNKLPKGKKKDRSAQAAKIAQVITAPTEVSNGATFGEAGPTSASHPVIPTPTPSNGQLPPTPPAPKQGAPRPKNDRQRQNGSAQNVKRDGPATMTLNANQQRVSTAEPVVTVQAITEHKPVYKYRPPMPVDVDQADPANPVDEMMRDLMFLGVLATNNKISVYPDQRGEVVVVPNDIAKFTTAPRKHYESVGMNTVTTRTALSFVKSMRCRLGISEDDA